MEERIALDGDRRLEGMAAKMCKKEKRREGSTNSEDMGDGERIEKSHMTRVRFKKKGEKIQRDGLTERHERRDAAARKSRSMSLARQNWLNPAF